MRGAVILGAIAPVAALALPAGAASPRDREVARLQREVSMRSLRIDGRRLDAPAPPLGASIPDGYGDSGFQSTAITFPTGGCWEVTGRVGEASLTFVTLVIPA